MTLVALVCCLSVERNYAKSGEYHPIMMVTMKGQAETVARKASVEPWLLTNGERVVMVHHYCGALATHKRPPLSASQLGDHAKWLRTHCLGGGDVNLDGSQYFGSDNHGVELTIGTIELHGVLEAGRTTIALKQPSDNPGWWQDLGMDPKSTIGFYILAPNRELLRRVVPIATKGTHDIETLSRTAVQNAIPRVGTSDLLCPGPREKCVDGWLVVDASSKSPHYEGQVPAVSNLFFADLDGDHRDDLVVGLRAAQNVVDQPGPAAWRGAWRATLVLFALKAPWIRGNVHEPGLTEDEDLSQYRSVLYLPRAALRIGQCSYIATVLMAEETESNDLLVVPRQDRVCRHLVSSRPYGERY